MRMKPLDRVLCITAALFGIGAFLFALRGVGDPRNAYPGWVLPFGILCLIAGLTAASFVTWHGRWRSPSASSCAILAQALERVS